MCRDNTTEGSRSTNMELAKRSTTNTQTFLEACVLDADHEALEEHLVNNPVQQSDLDRCLLRGLQIVQRKERELSHVAQTLTLLLQSGAKWDSEALLDKNKTPYHIICQSRGDHYELLDLMIKSSQQTILDARDSSKCTAILYAVHNENINCLKCLIADGADVHKDDDFEFGCAPREEVSAIMQVLRYNTSRSVHKDVFELLLDKYPIESYTSLITYAIICRNVYCIKKLIEKGTRLDVLDYADRCVWSRIAQLGNVELLDCMFTHGIDKDSTDEYGLSVLWYVVYSGYAKAVRYLLDLGVVIPPCTQEVLETQCDQCKENTLIVDNMLFEDPVGTGSCIITICYNDLKMIKLLEKHGSQNCKPFNALRNAVTYGSVDVTSYLLNNYNYPLNIKYTQELDPSGSVYTILTEPRIRPRRESAAKITKLLLDHGADPAKQMCSRTSVNAVMSAIAVGNLDAIAQYIHSGVDVSFRSYDLSYGMVLPFEASALRGHHDIAEMFLISGCSCGVFNLKNNHKFKDNLKPEVEKLIKEWQVQENNVTPLKQRCRNVILNHLSPQADVKIGKLPLPRLLITFLSILEIDAIVDAHK